MVPYPCKLRSCRRRPRLAADLESGSRGPEVRFAHFFFWQARRRRDERDRRLWGRLFQLDPLSLAIWCAKRRNNFFLDDAFVSVAFGRQQSIAYLISELVKELKSILFQQALQYAPGPNPNSTY
jgi:hypothetical protein